MQHTTDTFSREPQGAICVQIQLFSVVALPKVGTDWGRPRWTLGSVPMK